MQKPHAVMLIARTFQHERGRQPRRPYLRRLNALPIVRTGIGQSSTLIQCNVQYGDDGASYPKRGHPKNQKGPLHLAGMEQAITWRGAVLRTAPKSLFRKSQVGDDNEEAVN